jgi:hypothetical protein
MKKILGLVCGLLLLTSCETIDGSLDVKKVLTLKDSKGKSVNINLGIHEDAAIKLKSKKRLRLVLDDRKFEFKIPRSARIPTNNGTIFLESSQVKQAYDVSGEVRTEVTHGDRQRQRESCNWQEPYTVCRTDQNGRRVCRTEYRTRYGWRDIEFHYDLIDKNLQVSLLLPGTNVQAAHFGGEERYYQKVIDYEGRCF